MSEIVNKKENMNLGGSAPKTRSKMPFSNGLATTLRYGRYTPFFCMECVNGDRVNLQLKHDIKTYTLKAPLMNNIVMRKDVFAVPMQAILPLNWDKIYVNPTIGDDIDATKANCAVKISDLTEAIKTINSRIKAAKEEWDEAKEEKEAGAANEAMASYYQFIVTMTQFLETIFSKGSTFANLGISLQKYLTDKNGKVSNYEGNEITFNEYVTILINQIWDAYQDDFISFLKNGFTYKPKTKHEMMMRIMENEITLDAKSATAGLNNEITDEGYLITTTFTTSEKQISIARVIAYSMSCAHFYTNDKVDYVYSAELYRQNIKDALLRVLNFEGAGYNSIEELLKFEYNGIYMYYDTLSAEALKITLDKTENGFDYWTKSYDVWRLIAGYNRSLRYVDYFTGSKTRPLAIGDTNVQVVGGEVDVIDVTRNIMYQKFLNFCNKTGRKAEEYMSKLGGNYVAKDYHNPWVVSLSTESIGTYETENTGEAQVSNAYAVTSTFTGKGSKYINSVEIDRPTILIGIVSFDIERYYDNIIEKQNFHIDRFDMFNTFLQFIGDQRVEGEEIATSTTAFGYQGRHEEYKTRVNIAAGGFAGGHLPGWQYIADTTRPTDELWVISPDYIRARETELDEFYTSLTGETNEDYFHFVAIFSNVNNPSRPMAYNPNILNG